MGEISLWPWIALGAFLFGVSTGIAWAAMWRPFQLNLNLKVEREDA